MMDGKLYAKLCRLNELAGLITSILESKGSGNVRLSERHPAEYVELRRLADEFRASEMAELQRLGFRIWRVSEELDETDRLHRDKRAEGRQCRKQRELLVRSLTQLDEAWRALFDKVVTANGV